MQKIILMRVTIGSGDLNTAKDLSYAEFVDKAELDLISPVVAGEETNKENIRKTLHEALDSLLDEKNTAL